MNPFKDCSRIQGRNVKLALMTLREREDLLEIRSLRMGFSEALEIELGKIRESEKGRRICRSRTRAK